MVSRSKNPLEWLQANHSYPSDASSIPHSKYIDRICDGSDTLKEYLLNYS